MSVKSTSSTRGSVLLCRTKRRNITFPGAVSHDGTDAPDGDLRWKPKNLSCGVVLVDVESSERIEWRTLGSTSSH